MYKFFTIFSLILISSLFSVQAYASDKDIVAKIGERTITLSDFDRIISYALPDKQKLIQSNPQLKEEILKQYVNSIVLSDLAKKKGFDQTPEMKEKLDFYKDSFIANEFLRKEVTDKLTLSEEEKMEYYKSHLNEFKVPEMVRARHILIAADKSASPEEKKKARQKAVDILQRLQAGEDFPKLASEFSDDQATKANGGDMGFFPKGMIIKPFEEAAFSLHVGEISEVIETQYGYDIIKVEEKKSSYVQPYDEVKDKISQKHLQENMLTENKKFLEKSMKDADAVIYPEIFSAGTKK